jgi:hypothetical protein
MGFEAGSQRIIDQAGAKFRETDDSNMTVRHCIRAPNPRGSSIVDAAYSLVHA